LSGQIPFVDEFELDDLDLSKLRDLSALYPLSVQKKIRPLI
jgi:hypothetical protein